MKKKYKIILLSSLIILACVLIIGVTYAYYIFNVSQSGSNVVRTDCFEITYTDGNAINLSETIPLTDKEARELNPYSFTIKNICNQAVDYSVNIETLNTSTMDLNAIATKLDGRKKQILGQLDDNESIVNNNATSSKTIYSYILKAGEEKTHNLRLWVDIDATVEQSASKEYESKVVVSGVLHPNYSEVVLCGGYEFNQKIKELAGDENPSTETYNSSIKSIQKSLTPPTESDNAVDVSLKYSSSFENVYFNKSEKPIYAWFDDGIIYIYFDNDKIIIPYGNSMFMNLTSVESIDLSIFDTSNTVFMASMFSGMSNLKTLDFKQIDTSNVTDMSYMLSNTTSIISLDLSFLDTSSVTNMSGMFYGMSNLTSLAFGTFDISNVVNMTYMFARDTSLTNLDLRSFDTSNVTNMSSMFSGDISLVNLDVSSFNTSKVTRMNMMFYNCKALIDLDLRNFNTSNVTDMMYMFSGMSNATRLDVSSFDTSNVVTIDNIFNGMSSLESIDISNFDLSSATNVNSMFRNMSNLRTIYSNSSWNIPSETVSYNMFEEDTNLVGGAGTTYVRYKSAEYARIDDPTNGNPGYFTLKTN